MRSMGCDYYKLDFLDGALGKMGEPKKSVYRFKSDYSVAMFRRVLSTIREAAGEDAILLSAAARCSRRWEYSTHSAYPAI